MHDTGGAGQGGEPSGTQAASSAPASGSGSSLLGSGSSGSGASTATSAAASNAPATAPTTATAAASGQSPSKRPASSLSSSSSSSLGMGGYGSGGGRGFVDVLRSMGQLALCNAPQIQDELRSLIVGATGGRAAATSGGTTGTSIGSVGGGRRRGGPEEAAAVLAELASLASCLNELVASAVGAVGSGEQGADTAEGGGGAVAVGGRLLGGTEEGEGGGLHLHAHAAAAAAASSFQQQLHQLLQQQLHISGPHLLHAPHAAGPAAVVAEDEEEAAAHAGPRPSPVLAVLGDAALLHYVLDFVAAPAMAHRRQLGTLALVSRQWRDLAHSERFWRPIVLQLFPRLSPTAVDHDEDEAATGTATGAAGAGAGTQSAAAMGALAGPGGEGAHGAQGGAEWYRKYLVQYGRCLFEHPIRQGPWHEGITLSFDLHDEQDGTRLFSSTGPIRFTGTTIPGITAMKLTGRRRRVTTPFSASGRDPSGHLGSIEELFQEGDSPEYPVAFTIRVTARDERTGKMALLFASSKRTKRWVEPLGEDMGVPQGTLLVNQGWARVTIPGTDLAMQMLTVFYVAPIEAQGPLGQPAPPQGQQQAQAGQQAGAPPPPLQQHGGGGGQQPQPHPQPQPPQQQQQAAGAVDGAGQGQGQGAGQGNAPPPAGGMAVAGGGVAAGPGGGAAGGGDNGPADPAHRQYAVLTLDCAFMLQCKTECTESIGRFILAALEHGPSLERSDD